MGRGVTSAQVEAYQGMVESHARRFSAMSDMQNGYDDLVQEGLIAVWETLRDGFKPSNVVVENRMKDWCKIERRKGLSGYDELDSETPALR